MYLIFDTETTGLPRNWNAPISDTDNWPRCIQIAWQLHGPLGELLDQSDFLIQADGFDIPFDAEKIHGISTDLSIEQGVPIKDMMNRFESVLAKADFVVGQNVAFDVNIMACEMHRLAMDTSLLTEKAVLDTCTEKTAQLCKIPGGRGGKFKLPNLTELHDFLFGEPFAQAHNATADVEATSRCFFELIRKAHYDTQQLRQETTYLSSFQQVHTNVIQKIGLKHLNLKSESQKIKNRKKSKKKVAVVDTEANIAALENIPFSHLHNHTQYSVLQSTTQIDNLIDLAVKYEMPAVAITDHANLYGAYKFINAIYNHPINKEIIAHNMEAEEPKPFALKGIVGSELFVCRDHKDKTQKDNGYSQVFLAKNKEGYHNLSKMSSIGFVDGFYYVPRIDKEVVSAYKDGLIALSGGLKGEVSDLLLNVGEKQAEEAFVWWKNTFSDDFYVELVRHGLPEEEVVNEVLLRFARKYGVKVIAANNTYYLSKDDANAHDILLCVKDAELQSTPKGRGRGYRFGFPNEEYYFKSQEQMKALFADLPEAISNTNELIDKVESFHLKRDVLLPAFDIPKEFINEQDEEDGGKRGENAYLKHLTYEGAKKRYGTITPEISERLDFELATIENTGYPGYFLIVQDITTQARKMGVSNKHFLRVYHRLAHLVHI